MSEENVETIERVYDCLARRDWDAMWRDFDPDCVLDTQASGLVSRSRRVPGVH